MSRWGSNEPDPFAYEERCDGCGASVDQCRCEAAYFERPAQDERERSCCLWCGDSACHGECPMGRASAEDDRRELALKGWL